MEFQWKTTLGTLTLLHFIISVIRAIKDYIACNQDNHIYLKMCFAVGNDEIIRDCPTEAVSPDVRTYVGCKIKSKDLYM